MDWVLVGFSMVLVALETAMFLYMLDRSKPNSPWLALGLLAGLACIFGLPWKGHTLLAICLSAVALGLALAAMLSDRRQIRL